MPMQNEERLQVKEIIEIDRNKKGISLPFLFHMTRVSKGLFPRVLIQMFESVEKTRNNP